MIIEIVKTGFSLAKNSPFKLAIIAGVVAAILAFVEYRLHAEYKRGYYKAKIEAQEREQRLLVQRAKENKKRLQKAIEARDNAKSEAEKLQKELAKKPKVSTRTIYEQTIDCDNICPNAFSLLKSATKKPTGISRRPRIE